MPYAVFYNGDYAIHGTNDLGRLGRPASAGCIRLHPRHAAELAQAGKVRHCREQADECVGRPQVQRERGQEGADRQRFHDLRGDAIADQPALGEGERLRVDLVDGLKEFSDIANGHDAVPTLKVGKLPTPGAPRHPQIS